MNKITDFIKETPERTLTPSIVQGHREKTAIYQPESWHVFLGLSNLQNYREKKCLLFLSHLIYSILLKPPEQTQPES